MLLHKVARDPGFGVTSAPFDLDALPRVAGTAGESRVRQAYSANARYGAYDPVTGYAVQLDGRAHIDLVCGRAGLQISLAEAEA